MTSVNTETNEILVFADDNDGYVGKTIDENITAFNDDYNLTIDDRIGVYNAYRFG